MAPNKNKYRSGRRKRIVPTKETRLKAVKNFFNTEAIDKVIRPQVPKLNQPEAILRRQWKALWPSGRGCMDPLEFPVRQVVVTYTGTPTCDQQESCTPLLQRLQSYFMHLGYHDIPYSFVVSTSGLLYEGRAWIDECPVPEVLGDSANILVIGVIGRRTDIVGHFKDNAESAIKKVIDHGVKHELIEANYLRRDMDPWQMQKRYKPPKEVEHNSNAQINNVPTPTC